MGPADFSPKDIHLLWTAPLRLGSTSTVNNGADWSKKVTTICFLPWRTILVEKIHSPSCLPIWTKALLLWERHHEVGTEIATSSRAFRITLTILCSIKIERETQRNKWNEGIGFINNPTIMVLVCRHKLSQTKSPRSLKLCNLHFMNFLYNKDEYSKRHH